MKELKSNYDIQLKTSEKSVEEYKMKVELQMNKMFDDMKKEVSFLVTAKDLLYFYLSS